MDVTGDVLEKEDGGNSYLPADSYTLGKVEGDDILPYTLSGDQLLGEISEDEEIFMIDPWSKLTFTNTQEAMDTLVFCYTVRVLMESHPNLLTN